MPPAPAKTCSRCAREGFRWNKSTCFYCGQPDDGVTPLKEEDFRKRFGSVFGDDPLPGRFAPPDQVGAGSCANCSKDGFRWNRNYCSYCGWVDASIDPVHANTLRKHNDALFDLARREARLRSLRSGNSDASYGGDGSSFSSGDSFGSGDSCDSGSNCSDG